MRVGSEAPNAPTRTVATGIEPRFTNIINKIGRHIYPVLMREERQSTVDALVAIQRQENDYS